MYLHTSKENIRAIFFFVINFGLIKHLIENDYLKGTFGIYNSSGGKQLGLNMTYIVSNVCFVCFFFVFLFLFFLFVFFALLFEDTLLAA